MAEKKKRQLRSGEKAAVAVASSGRCYNPECNEPLILVRDGHCIINFEIAHIRDELQPMDEASDVGWRYWPAEDLTQEERNRVDNLILMCQACHKLIDRVEPRSYSVEKLRQWKTDSERNRTFQDNPQPRDFTNFIVSKRFGFIGRDWLFDQVEDWRVARTNERSLLITGDPGSGKSAFLAELIHRSSDRLVLAHHFCQWDTPSTLNPAGFVRSLVAMIASNVAGYAVHLNVSAIAQAISEIRCQEDPASAFEDGILAPLACLPAPAESPKYILIDALDEALGISPGIVDLLASRIDRLPSWIRIVATTRNERGVLEGLGDLRAKTISAQSNENLNDIKSYIRSRLASPSLTRSLTQMESPAETVERLISDKSAGNFLYARQALDGIEREIYRIVDLESTPPGLKNLYKDFFRRNFPDKASFDQVRPVLEVAATAQEPLAADQFADAAGVNSSRELAGILERLGPYLSRSTDNFGKERLAIYHKSLADWLADPVLIGDDEAFPDYRLTPEQGHAHLAAWCWRQYQQGMAALSPYALDYIQTHLAQAHEWERSAQLFSDHQFVAARCARSGFPAVYAAARTLADHADLPDYWRNAFRSWEQFLQRRINYLGESPGLYAKEVIDEFLPSAPEPLRSILGGIVLPRRHATLRKLSGRLAVREPGHTSYVNDVTFSPDGRLLASAEAAKTALIWDATRRDLIAECRLHTDIVVNVAFSPDGTTLASASRDGTAKLWNTDGSLIADCVGHGAYVDRVKFSPDGEVLATRDTDGQLRTWNSQTGELLAVCDGNGISEMAFADGSTLVASRRADGGLAAWDSRSGKLVTEVEVAAKRIWNFTNSQPGRLLVCGTKDGMGELCVWDALNGKLVAGTATGADTVTIAALSDGGHFLGEVSKEGRAHSLRLWRLDSGRLTLKWAVSTDELGEIRFSPNEELLAVGTESGKIEIWSVRAGTRITTCDGTVGRELLTGNVSLSRLAFSPDNSFIAACANCDLKVWDVASGTLLSRHDSVETARSVLSPDGRLAATGGNKGRIEIWEAETGTSILARRAHLDVVDRVAFSPTVALLASGGGDGFVRLWDIRKKTQLMEFDERMGNVTELCFSSDGRYIGVGDENGGTNVWKSETGELVHSFDFEVLVSAAEFSPDGTLFAIGLANGMLGVADLYTNEVIVLQACIKSGGYNRQDECCFVSISFSHDGQLLASCSEEGTIQIWRPHEGELMVDFDESLEVDFHVPLAFSPDDHLLAAGNSSGDIYVWNALSGRMVSTCRGHRGEVSTLSFTPGHALLLSGGNDGTVRLWDYLNGEECDKLLLSYPVCAMTFPHADPETLVVMDESKNGFSYKLICSNSA
jgi:WD40 repeat protein